MSQRPSISVNVSHFLMMISVIAQMWRYCELSNPPAFPKKRATILSSAMALALLNRFAQWKTRLLLCVVLTVKQVADALHMSQRTVLLMARRKELPAFKLGGQWRIHESELAKFIHDLEEL
jgi:excisionase family DNA binding protein